MTTYDIRAERPGAAATDAAHSIVGPMGDPQAHDGVEPWLDRMLASIRSRISEVRGISLQAYRHDGHEFLGAGVWGEPDDLVAITFLVADEFRPDLAQPIVVDMTEALFMVSSLARRLGVEARI